MLMSVEREGADMGQVIIRNCQGCSRQYPYELARTDRPKGHLCHTCRVEGPPSFKGVWKPIEWEDPPAPDRKIATVPLADPLAPEVSFEVEPTDTGHVVATEKTGKTTHRVKTREPLEAVCGTRNVRLGKEPVFYPTIPPGLFPCWKCERGG